MRGGRKSQPLWVEITWHATWVHPRRPITVVKSTYAFASFEPLLDSLFCWKTKFL